MTDLLTVKQACQHFKVSRNTLMAMIADGRLDAVDCRRPGGKYALWRIKPHSLQNVADLKFLDLKRRSGL
jgi:excisionase family DNA binding protein